jgi:Bacterial PH domain
MRTAAVRAPARVIICRTRCIAWILGNGGAYSFSGEFWNRRLGRYRALATDPDRAVVLRYPKRTIVITPHDPQQFIMRARTLLEHAQFEGVSR